MPPKLNTIGTVGSAVANIADKNVAKMPAPAPAQTATQRATPKPQSLGSRDISTLTAQDITSAFGKPTANVSVNVPNTIPSEVVGSGVTTQDVLDKRAGMEKEQADGQAFADFLAQGGTSQSQADLISRFVFPQQSPELTSAYEGERSLLTQAGDYLKGLFGRDSTTEYNRLRDEAGIPDIQSQIAESNKRLAQLRGEQMKIRPQIETEAGQTRIGAEARLSPIERQLTAEIGAEALIQSALSGNLELAQQNVDRLIELQTADEERNLAIFDQRIKLEQARVDSLTGQAKEQAQARLNAAEIMLKDRQDALDAVRDEKKQIADIAVAYVEATGDGSGALSIIKSQTLGDALRIAGPSIGPQVGGAKPFIITSGAAKIPATEIQAGAQALNASVGNDGYANTKLYNDMLGDWVSSGANLVDFFKQFPPDQYLNPADPSIPPQIKAQMQESDQPSNPFK